MIQWINKTKRWDRWPHFPQTSALAGLWYTCHRGCGYNNNQRPHRHCLPVRAKYTQTHHVLGNQPGSCRYVCWRSLLDHRGVHVRIFLRALEDRSTAKGGLANYFDWVPFRFSYGFSDKPRRYLFGADPRHLSTIQAPSPQKMGFWSSCCSRLDHRCSKRILHLSGFLLHIKRSWRVLLVFVNILVLFFCHRCVLCVNRC